MSNLPERTLDSLLFYVIQMDIVWKAKSENLNKVQQLFRTVKPESGSVVVLPEMFTTGFCMDFEEICEEPGGHTEKLLSKLASDYEVLIIAGISLKSDSGKGKNSAVAIKPDGSVAFRFVKLHPFNPANEELYYERGCEVVVADYSGWKISPFICYDLRFPESYRAAALGGAEILITIANWPEKRASHWLPLLQARAIENLAYVVGVNRIGCSPENRYSGESIILNPWGEVVISAGKSECIIRAELKKETINNIRKNFPCLDDAKPSLSARVKHVKI
jgi:predicted amidohydrolase